MKWSFLGAKPGQIGVLLELDLAVGLFRVLSSDGLEGSIELIDIGADGVFTRDRNLRLLEVSFPPEDPKEASILVWSPALDAPIVVDGQEVARTPAYINLEVGAHEISVKFPDGSGAGTRLEATGASKDTLYLHGLEREVSSRWNPAYLLEKAGSGGKPPNEGRKPSLQWIDEAGGARLYLGFPPVKLPVITHKVVPAYPEAAMKSGIRGRVALEAIIGTDGLIHGARVIASHDAMLSHAALEAIKEWTYMPATLEGSPVPVVFTITVDFGV
ncbi:MAG TPA: energy transducer TonB [Candidatus Polarisedimenticolia bacterium]|nr:energy transducer TonB [Candidatus Polarisedimenticolia bacterium]